MQHKEEGGLADGEDEGGDLFNDQDVKKLTCCYSMLILFGVAQLINKC